MRFITRLSRGGFDSAVLLHHSRTLSFAVFAAGIPHRFGYGFPAQRPFLNRPPYLPAADRRGHPHGQANAYIAATGWASGAEEPLFSPSSDARQRVVARLAQRPGPIVAVGVGSSEPTIKQWGEANFAALCNALQAAGWPVLAVIGGPAEAAMIARLAAVCPAVLPVADWQLDEVAALLARAAFYVGNDTATLNLAAAVQCRGYGLFGGSDPMRHSPHIVPLLPPDGRREHASGMRRIAVDAVLAGIAADRGDIRPL